jgi:hypothetical protein
MTEREARMVGALARLHEHVRQTRDKNLAIAGADLADPGSWPPSVQFAEAERVTYALAVEFASAVAEEREPDLDVNGDNVARYLLPDDEAPSASATVGVPAWSRDLTLT